MTPTEFLSLVLPPQNHGYYCAAGFSKNSHVHKFVDSVDELYVESVRFSESLRDSYFAVATFSERGSRTAANALHIRSFFVDLDIGDKGYSSPADAALALQQWVKTTKLSRPMVVFSGAGLHAYWPFVDAVSIGRWKPYAEGLKRAAVEHGLRIDFSVSADAARVLRVPGTSSFKYGDPRKVYVAAEGAAPKDFEFYARLLEPYLEKEIPQRTKEPAQVATDSILDAAPAYATNKTSFTTNLLEVTENRFESILALGEQGCAQINHYMQNPTDDGMEPLWRATISIAKYCVEGEEKAYEISRLHPYDDRRTASKLSDIRGPYTCLSFSRHSSGKCEKCPHWGKIKSPIALGRELKPQEEDKEVEVQVGAFTQKHAYPEPINNFSLSDYGVAVKYSEDGIPRTALVADTPVYASATYDRAGERWVQFIYVEHGTAKSAVLPLATVTSREDGIKGFAKLGILVNNGYDNHFRSYIRDTIAQAKKAPPLLMPTSLGWQEDDSFAFDNRVFTPGSERVVPMYGFENISESMGCKGSLDMWKRIASKVVSLQRPDITAMMMLGFAAPLMKFTGLNGVTFHLCGNDSGRGKTLCQRLASSVWGVPDKFRITPNTSAVAMINRMGMLGNLPLLVDEITHKGRNDAEWFPEFLSQMSDGRGKERMESQANAERRNTTSWSSIALLTSNKHMMDYLTAERTHGSEGEIRRLVEIVFDRQLDLDDEAKTLLFEELPKNYGTAGEAYAKFLVDNAEYVKDAVRRTYTSVFKQFESSGDERFWVAGCAAIIAACGFVRKAGILDADAVSVTCFLESVIRGMREEVSASRRTALDILNAFTKRNYGKIVVVNGKVAHISGIEVAETLDRQDLCGRVERRHDGWLDYYIEEKEIKAFCSSLSYGYNEFRRDIAKYAPLKRARKDILSGTRGPMMVVPCIHIRQQADAIDILFPKAANE